MDISPLILENLKYFITTVVENASQPGWNYSEFQRAQKWAAYCKKVFTNLANIGDGEQKKCLDLLTEVIPGTSANELGIMLEDPISTLNKTLMQNPYLDDSLFGELLKANFNLHDHTPNENFLKDMLLVAQTRAMVIHLLDSLSKYGDQNLDISIWIASLRHIYGKQLQDTSAIDEVFKSAWASNNLLGTILKVFVAMKAEDNECFTKLLDIFLHSCTHSRARIMLLRQKSMLLVHLSSLSMEFFEKFVEMLTKEGKLLRSPSGVGTDSSWEHSPPHISFQEMITHWSNLVKSNITGELAKSSLQKLAKDASQPVWKAIYVSAVKEY